MKTCYVGVKAESVEKLAKRIEEDEEDVIILPVVSPKSVSAPTKKKPNHMFEFVAMVPPDILKEEYQKAAISNFGGFIVMRLPKHMIKPEFLGK
ncbi:hypothetical protein [Brevibacillus fortis]|uniref:Uncharacterized protein n=1 Tax=Brevibacillus fortis TaxID=2126352 RepID=A0A2P7V3T9_9BACL|nr:hypothetical protein [Brevibacillus fortis]PSJ93868.1 hypothetical protein C7R93_16945 [Brevibacillus fortis]